MMVPKPLFSRLRILVPLAWCAGIFIASSLPADSTRATGQAWWDYLSPLAQNLLHVPVFAGLAWSWAWALRHWQERRGRQMVTAFLFTALYAGLDEWHQSFVPGRTASLVDFMLDLTGAALGLWLAARHDGQARTGT